MCINQLDKIKCIFEKQEKIVVNFIDCNFRNIKNDRGNENILLYIIK